MSGDDNGIRAKLSRIADRFARDDPGSAGHFIGRFVVLRLLGLVYLMAFLTLVNQGPGLIGAHGLLPAASFLDAVAAELGGRGAAFMQLPSLFWLGTSDAAIAAAGWTGIVLSLVVLAGYANALILAVLCALQISVLVIGQDFYGFGWETQLVETGFLCIFLCPLLDGRPFPRRPPPAIVVWLLRWLIVRVMWGAGLIKLRGDACWRDLSCLDFHFETQPIPSPLTPLFHFLPPLAHKLGVLFNHVVELAAPFFVFGPRRVRYAAGHRHGGAADRAAGQRQPVVPQLADAGADPRLLRRQVLGARAAARRWSRAPPARAPPPRRRARRARPPRCSRSPSWCSASPRC